MFRLPELRTSRSFRRAAGDVLVLCYHAVSPTWTAALSVTPRVLEAHLTLLMQRGWRATTFSTAILRPPWPRTLSVTFDDAFLSVLGLAHPVLSRLGIPATVFVPTAFPSRRQPLQWDGVAQWLETPFAGELECMNWDDLRTLVADGWEIGSHTRTHPRLTELGEQALRFELEESRREVTACLGVPCESLAYPYGAADGRVEALAADAGYVAAAGLSSSLRPGGRYRWPRVGVHHVDDIRRFGLKVNPVVRRMRASRIWPAHE